MIYDLIEVSLDYYLQGLVVKYWPLEALECCNNIEAQKNRKLKVA